MATDRTGDYDRGPGAALSALPSPLADKDPTETWMWERARALIDQADRIQKSFFQPRTPGTRQPAWEPPVDVFETPAEVLVLVALPGIDAESIQIEVSGHEIVVQGERPQPPAFHDAVIHRMEIPYGRFERRVGVPPGTYTLTQRQLANGCLLLRLTKSV